MNKEKFNENLIDFIKNSTCAFTCIKKIKEKLLEANFQELKETDTWNNLSGNYFVIRNDASIIAFKVKNTSSSFQIITTHSDTPSLLLKNNGVYIKDNYLKHNVMPYGGILNYGFLDTPFSLAGRIFIEKNNKLLKKIIDIKEEIAIIPSVAIHLNDKANTNLDLNAQNDLTPFFLISDKTSDFDKLLKEKLNLTKSDKIRDYELFLYSTFSPKRIGLKKEILLSPRIDNQTSVFTSMQSFLESDSKDALVFCAFNNEEIGSLTREGAESDFLISTLKRICTSLNLPLASALSNSLLISADNTHAVHPNHPELADETGKVYLNKGFAIIKEATSTTDACFSSLIKMICDKEHIMYQDSTLKNDITGGSTLSALTLRHVSIPSLEVGIGELAMHSSLEVASLIDIYELYKMLKVFLNTKKELL